MHGHDVEQRFSQIRRAAFRGPAAAGALVDAGKGPVTDNTVTVGEILLRHAGFVKKMGLDAPYPGESSAHGELKKTDALMSGSPAPGTYTEMNERQSPTNGALP